MKIEATYVQFDAVQKNSSTLSVEDNKVHCYVILRELLVSLSLISGIGAIIFAVTLNPAFATILIPSIALCILGLSAQPNSVNKTPPPPTEPFVEGQPIGLKNGSCNCWINAAMQLFIHTQSYRDLIEDYQEECKVIKNFIDAYEVSRQKQLRVAVPTTQKIREWLHNDSNLGISKHAWEQEDAIDFFNHLFSVTQYSLPIEQQVNNSGDWSKNTTHYIDIPLETGKKPASFDQLMERFYYDKADPGTGNEVHVTKKFTSAPNAVLMYLRRFNNIDGVLGKYTEQVPVPMEITLSDSSYHVTGFIEHSGTSHKGGHYYCYLLKEGIWWKCNDASVTKATEKQLQAAMSRAYIYNFTKSEN